MRDVIGSQDEEVRHKRKLVGWKQRLKMVSGKKDNKMSATISQGEGSFLSPEMHRDTDAGGRHTKNIRN